MDEFLKLHTEYIDGEVKLAFCDLTQDVANKIAPDSKKNRKKKRKSNKTAYRKGSKYADSVKESSRSITKDTINANQPLYYIDNLKEQAKFIETKPRPKMKIFNKDSIFADQPSYIENWKGQAIISKTKRMPKITFM